jgi:hypothetical protein
MAAFAVSAEGDCTRIQETSEDVMRLYDSRLGLALSFFLVAAACAAAHAQTSVAASVYGAFTHTAEPVIGAYFSF